MQTTDQEGIDRNGAALGGDRRAGDTGTGGSTNLVVRYLTAKAAQMQATADLAEIYDQMDRTQRMMVTSPGWNRRDAV